MVKALAEAGWGAVSPTAVQIKDTSGMGGSKTFRADAPAGTTPPAVALHVRSDEVVNDPFTEHVQAEAAGLFGAAGLVRS